MQRRATTKNAILAGSASIASEPSLGPASIATSTTPKSLLHNSGDRPPPTSGADYRRRAPLNRSCVLCHRRKVRCDKKLPCSACTRGRHECSYLDTSVVPAKKARKTTIADMALRISDLEKSIAAVGGQQGHGQVHNHVQSQSQSNGSGRYGISTSPAPSEERVASVVSRTLTSITSTTPPSHPSILDGRDYDHVLLKNGTSSQYLNETLLLRILEDNKNNSSLLSMPPAEPMHRELDSLFSLLGILSNPTSFDQHASLTLLLKGTAMRVWQVFVHNVDPAVKVLRIPTTEEAVFAAIHNPDAAQKDVKALLYAIFFTAVVSMQENEVLATMETDQNSSLKHLRTQYHWYLALSNPLETPTIVMLQSLAIFLMAVHSQNHGRGMWVVNGMAILLAQSMGLHRDGSGLGQTPFESEMRRRLWWFMLSRHCRNAEDHGINSWATLPSSDTKFPLNVADEDLWPDMTELPPPRPGWTKMTLPLITMEIMQAWRELWLLSLSSEPTAAKQAVRAKALRDLRHRVESVGRTCSSYVPIQTLTQHASSYMLHKMELITRQQLAFTDAGRDNSSLNLAIEEDLVAACECLEINVEGWSDELFRQFRWSMSANPQFYMLLYIMWHLCVRPEGPSVDRAWRAANASLELEMQRQCNSAMAPTLKLMVAQKLKKGAELIRDALTSSQAAEGGGGDIADARDLRSSEPQPVSQRDVGVDNVDWNTMQLLLDLPDWNTLVEDLCMTNDDFIMYI